jgi:hypothetical protein
VRRVRVSAHAKPCALHRADAPKPRAAACWQAHAPT